MLAKAHCIYFFITSYHTCYYNNFELVVFLIDVELRITIVKTSLIRDIQLFLGKE